MNDTDASWEDAHEFVRSLISATWKKASDEAIASSPFYETFGEIGMSIAWVSQCMYQHRDGHGIEDQETKERVLALLHYKNYRFLRQHEIVILIAQNAAKRHMSLHFIACRQIARIRA